MLTTNEPLTSSDAAYITRPFIADVVSNLTAATHPYIGILGGRQTGKTTALYHIIEQLLTNRHACAYIDLAQISEQRSEPEVWIAKLSATLQSSLLPKHLRNIAPNLTNIDAFPSHLYTVVDKLNPQHSLFIVLDNISVVPEHLLTFFHKIREMHNLRTQPGAPPQVKRIQFIFAGSFDPYTFIRTNANSPFNIAINFDTSEQDFSLAHVQAQADRAGHNAHATAIFQQTSGHPYVTNALINALDACSNVGEAIQSVLRTDVHFSMLQRLLDNNDGCIDTLQAIEQGKQLPYNRTSTDDLTFLITNSFVKPNSDGRATIRCEIYRRWFIGYLRRKTHLGVKLSHFANFANPVTRDHLEKLLLVAPEMMNLYPLLAPVCMGAILEAVLIEKLKSIADITPLADQLNVEVTQMAHLRGIDKISKKDGAYKPVSTWKLSQMIEIARIAGMLDISSAQISHALRDWRNLIHPEKYSTEYPDGFDEDQAQTALYAGRMLLTKLQR